MAASVELYYIFSLKHLIMRYILRPLHTCVILAILSFIIWRNYPLDVFLWCAVPSYFFIWFMLFTWFDYSMAFIRAILWPWFRNKAITDIAGLEKVNSVVYYCVYADIMKARTRFICEGWTAFRYWVEDLVEDEYKRAKYLKLIKYDDRE